MSLCKTYTLIAVKPCKLSAVKTVRIGYFTDKTVNVYVNEIYFDKTVSYLQQCYN